jgi:hypothetical protein
MVGSLVALTKHHIAAHARPTPHIPWLGQQHALRGTQLTVPSSGCCVAQGACCCLLLLRRLVLGFWDALASAQTVRWVYCVVALRTCHKVCICMIRYALVWLHSWCLVWCIVDVVQSKFSF